MGKERGMPFLMTFSHQLPISVTILTKNSCESIADVLDSLIAFEEVLIYDTGSTDETLTIAAQYPNVRIEKGELDGFGPTHNRAAALAKYDWIFSLDSDEILSEEGISCIRSLSLDPACVYRFPRHNYYRDQRIVRSGWSPDWVIRLYNKEKTEFTHAYVHESVVIKGMRVISLQAPLRHYSYRSIADFLQKMQHYTSLFAEQHVGKKKSSLCKAVLHGLFSFMKTYFFKLGFLDGKAGFEIAVYNANTAFYKYLKLWERNRARQRGCVDVPKKRGGDAFLLKESIDNQESLASSTKKKEVVAMQRDNE